MHNIVLGGGGYELAESEKLSFVGSCREAGPLVFSVATYEDVTIGGGHASAGG